jgi:hypothetical protein
MYVPQGMPAPHPEQASVLRYRDGRAFVLWPDGFREALPASYRFRRPRSVVEVQLGKRTTEFSTSLPALSGAARFPARVRVRWEVADPVKVAEAQLRNVGELLEPELSELLREVTQQYPIDRPGEAARAVREVLRDLHPPLGAAVGLRTKVYVELDVDEMVVRHYEEYRQDAADDRRMARFLAMVQQGDYAQAAVLVGEDRSNTAKAIDMIRSDRRATEEQTADRLRLMLEHGVIKSHNLDRSDRAWVDMFISAGGRIMSGMQPPALPGGSAPPSPPADWDVEAVDEDDAVSSVHPPGADPAPTPSRRSLGSGAPARRPPSRRRPANQLSSRRGPAWAGPEQAGPPHPGESTGLGSWADTGRDEDPGWGDDAGRAARDGWDSGDDRREKSRRDADDGWDRHSGWDSENSRAGNSGRGGGHHGTAPAPSNETGDDEGWGDARSDGRGSAAVDDEAGWGDESWYAPARRLDRPADEGASTRRGRWDDESWDDWGQDR